MNRCRPKSSAAQSLSEAYLGKFIYHPVVLARLDQDYLGRSARDVGRSRRDQNDRETVAARMSMAARDLEGPVLTVQEELFQLVGVLGVADVIAEHDHAVFGVRGLPCVQEMVRGCECKRITRVGKICLLRWMAA